MRPARNLNFLIDTHRNILKTFVKLFFLYLQYFLKYDAFKFSPDEDYCHARWSLLNLQQITQWRPLAFAWRLLLYDEVYLPYKHASITMTATAINLCEISLRLRLRYRFAFHISLLRKKILMKYGQSETFVYNWIYFSIYLKLFSLSHKNYKKGLLYPKKTYNVYPTFLVFSKKKLN